MNPAEQAAHENIVAHMLRRLDEKLDQMESAPLALRDLVKEEAGRHALGFPFAELDAALHAAQALVEHRGADHLFYGPNTSYEYTAGATLAHLRALAARAAPYRRFAEQAQKRGLAP